MKSTPGYDIEGIIIKIQDWQRSQYFMGTFIIFYYSMQFYSLIPKTPWVMHRLNLHTGTHTCMHVPWSGSIGYQSSLCLLGQSGGYRGAPHRCLSGRDSSPTWEVWAAGSLLPSAPPGSSPLAVTSQVAAQRPGLVAWECCVVLGAKLPVGFVGPHLGSPLLPPLISQVHIQGIFPPRLPSSAPVRPAWDQQVAGLSACHPICLL